MNGFIDFGCLIPKLQKNIILNFISELIIYKDIEHKILWVNRAAGKSVASDTEALKGRYCYQIWHQRDKPCVNCPMQKVIQTGELHEWEVESPDGRVWIIRGHPVRGPEGEIIGVIEIVTESTNHKRVEEELNRTKEELEAYNKELLAKNEQLKKTDKKLRQKFTELQQSRDALESANQKLKDTQVELLKYQNHLGELIQERTAQLQAEIKEHKRSQQELIRVKKAVESSSDGIILLNLAGKCIYQNQAAREMLQYSPEELSIAGSPAVLFSDPELGREIHNQVLTGESWCGEVEMCTRNGSKIPIFLRVDDVINDIGQIIGFIGILTDIREQKNLERQMARLERLNLVGEMAAGIAHEIRNPMTTVRGFLQMLRSKEECAMYKDYYNTMIKELDRANTIITEFLSMAKTKAANLKHHNLNLIIKKIFPLIKTNAMESGKHVKLELGDIPELLLDEKEIHQLILNLARNGLEAMSSGKTLTLKTYINDTGVCLAIRDQGSGIKPEIIEKLGTPFLTTKDNGTGMGIPVCFGIAARHNATIDIKTESQGTTFLVQFKTRPRL